MDLALEENAIVVPETGDRIPQHWLNFAPGKKTTDATPRASSNSTERASGSERGNLSPELIAHCDHVVKIPTQFCVNVGVAGAIVMYDRLMSSGQFAARPIAPGGSVEPPPVHQFGEPLWRKKARRRAGE